MSEPSKASRHVLIGFIVIAVTIMMTMAAMIVAMREQQSKQAKADPPAGFRPCVFDAEKNIDETPFEAPPRPHEAMVGNTYRWYVNDKTGEYLYRKESRSKFGLFLDDKGGKLKELKGEAKP